MHIGSITHKGFTLVELLVVVIILAILAVIVVPQFASSTDDARASSADSTLAGLRAAIDLYYQQHNHTYPGAVTAKPAAACAGTKGKGDASNATQQAKAFMAQLTLYTDVSGGACSVGDATNHKYGPYLKKLSIPADPFVNIAALEVVSTGDLNMTASADPGPGGFKYDIKTGKIIINLRAQETR